MERVGKSAEPLRELGWLWRRVSRWEPPQLSSRIARELISRLLAGFTAALVAEAVVGAAKAFEVNAEDCIRDILRRRIEVEKRILGMAVCLVTPDRQRIA